MTAKKQTIRNMFQTFFSGNLPKDVNEKQAFIDNLKAQFNELTDESFIFFVFDTFLDAVAATYTANTKNGYVKAVRKNKEILKEYDLLNDFQEWISDLGSSILHTSLMRECYNHIKCSTHSFEIVLETILE